MHPTGYQESRLRQKGRALWQDHKKSSKQKHFANQNSNPDYSHEYATDLTSQLSEHMQNSLKQYEININNKAHKGVQLVQRSKHQQDAELK